jgi:hypothetical protein
VTLLIVEGIVEEKNSFNVQAKLLEPAAELPKGRHAQAAPQQRAQVLGA